MAGPKSATEIMMLHDAARRRDVMALYDMPIITDCMRGITTKGLDMSKFTEWLMEMYPKTEDYVYIHGLRTEGKTSKRELYLRIKPDPQAFLEQMKEFDKMMKEED